MQHIKLISSIFIMCLPYFVTPKESFILEYDPDNFKQKIEEMDGNFIMFYAPWCNHCTDFRPIWDELGELFNIRDAKLAIAQINCTKYPKLCQDNDVTGYPTLLFFHKNKFTPIEYKGTRDFTSLTLFLSEVFDMEEVIEKEPGTVKVYGGMAYLTDNNIEKFISKGQHFIMFYVPWCKASQKLAPVWAELAAQYSHNKYIQIGKVNCMNSDITCKNFDVQFQYPSLLWIANGKIMGQTFSQTLEELNAYVKTMLLAENHDPEKFMKKKKVLPVARITEETHEAFLEKELVFINFFAPWCAHCMQLNPVWTKLGERFQNDSRVLIADVDCVRSKVICEIEQIHRLPTLVLYKNKKVVSSEQGGDTLESLIALVNEHLKDETEKQLELTSDATTKDEL